MMQLNKPRAGHLDLSQMFHGLQMVDCKLSSRGRKPTKKHDGGTGILA